MVGHRPAHDAAAEGVEDDGEVQPALTGACWVMSATHKRSGAGGLNMRRPDPGAGVAVGSRRVGPCRRRAVDADETVGTHEPSDTLAADADVQCEAQLGVDPRRPVGAPAAGVDLADLLAEQRIPA